MKKIIPIVPREYYRIKITLKEITPAIWRRVVVPADLTLAQFHDVIQISMGWQNTHLYQFRIGKLRFGLPDEDFPDDLLNSLAVKLANVVDSFPKSFTYEYDFGDSWEHDVKIEKIVEPEKGKRYPCCTEGARACPPEDCGGVPGYEDLLDAMKHPKKKENKEMLEWLGEYDPEAFDLRDVNEQLSEL